MWQSRVVERALCQWGRWQQTIVNQWIESGDESISGLESKAETQMRLLDFPKSYRLEVYWICMVASDFSFDDVLSFTGIAVPAGLCGKYKEWLEYNSVSPGTGLLPPQVWSEKDIERESYRLGLPKSQLYESSRDNYIYLPYEHELRSILGRFRGRPEENLGKQGRSPVYSDRLAVKCACKYPEMTYVEIAKIYNLPIRKPYLSKQSDTASHLVTRGRKLLEAIKNAS